MTSQSKFYIGKRVEANREIEIFSQAYVPGVDNDTYKAKGAAWANWFITFAYSLFKDDDSSAFTKDAGMENLYQNYDNDKEDESFTTFVVKLDLYIKQSLTNLKNVSCEAVKNLTKYIKHILYFLYVLSTTSSLRDISCAAGYILSNVMNDRTKDKIANKLANFYKLAKENMPLFSQGGTSGDKPTRYSDFLSVFLESNLFLSVKMLILNVVSLEFLPIHYYQTCKKYLGKLDSRPTPLEALRNILRSVEEMFFMVHKAIKVGSLKAVLFEEDPKAEFLDIAIDLISHYESVYFGKPENFHDVSSMKYRVPFDKYMIDLSSCINKGDHMYIAYKGDILFKSKLYQLRKIHAELYSRVAAAKRSPPIAFVIHGTPQIGKSSLLVHFYKVTAKYFDLKWSDDLVYTRNSEAEHWDGYDPVCNPIIHIPEAGSKHENIIKNQGSVVMDEILSLVDSSPYPVHMAELESKGKTYAQPKMVVIDTNNETMGVEITQSNPAAVLRRFIFIEPIVKHKFRVEAGTALDPTKVKNSSNPMDLWTFNIHIKVPKSSKEFTKINLGSSVDIFTLTRIINQLMDKHFKHNDSYMKMLDTPIEDYIPDHIINNSDDVPSPEVETVHIGEEEPLLSQSDFRFSFNVTDSIFYVVSFSFLIELIGLMYKMCIHIFRFTFIGALRSFICATLECWAWNIYKWRLRNKYKKELVILTSVCVAAPFVIGAASLCLSGAKFLESQSDFVKSSGNYTEDNYKSKLSEVEKKSKAGFPRPKTKLDTDKDYDEIKTFIPRYISDKRNYNEPIQVFNSIKKNRRYAVIWDSSGNTTSTVLLGIFGDWALVNYHALVKGIKIEVSIDKNMATSSFDMLITDNDYIKLPSDVALIKLRRCTFRDIRFAFCTDLLKLNVDFEMINWNTGELNNTLIRSNQGKMVGSKGNKPHKFFLPTYLKYPGVFVGGECGNPVIAKVNNQVFLVGIHTAGDEAYGYATTFSSDLLRSIPVEAGFNIYSEGPIRMPQSQSLGPISPGSPFYYEGTFGLKVIGGLTPLKVVKPRSRMKLTKIVRDIEYLFGVSPYAYDKVLKYDIPKMGRKSIEGTHGPYNVWIRKITKEKKCLPLDTCKAVSSLLLKYFQDNLPDEELYPLNLTIAQNGYPLNFYIRSMKNSTSGGYSFPGKKRNYLIESPQDFKNDAVEPTFPIIEQVLEIIDSYENGESAMNILGAQLKDEPRPRAKVDKGSTRVFAMSGYPESLVNRMYLLPFYTYMMSHGDVFRTAIGTNMHSIGAHEMRTKMWQFSNNFFGGDYGGYDTSMPIDVGYECNDIICKFLVSRGYNEYSMKIVRGILTDNLFPLLMVDGALVQIPGFQPSGKYATAEDNSLRGLYLLFYSFCVMCTPIGSGDPFNTTVDFEPLDFFSLTYILIYGDDNIGPVAELLKKHFNNLTYKNFCEKVYGMDFTLPTKGEISEPFLEEGEVSFLKRYFRFHKGLNRYVACLDKESLIKSLTWNVASSHVSTDVQTMESSAAALRELFYWCDDEKSYNEIRDRFIEVSLKRYKFQEFTVDSYFPTYHDIYNNSDPILESQSSVESKISEDMVDLDNHISIYELYGYSPERSEELKKCISDYENNLCTPQFYKTENFYILYVMYEQSVEIFVDKTDTPDSDFELTFKGWAEHWTYRRIIEEDDYFLNSQSISTRLNNDDRLYTYVNPTFRERIQMIINKIILNKQFQVFFKFFIKVTLIAIQAWACSILNFYIFTAYNIMHYFLYNENAFAFYFNDWKEFLFAFLLVIMWEFCFVYLGAECVLFTLALFMYPFLKRNRYI
jgi:hypothetical protein